MMCYSNSSCLLNLKLREILRISLGYIWDIFRLSWGYLGVVFGISWGPLLMSIGQNRVSIMIAPGWLTSFVDSRLLSQNVDSMGIPKSTNGDFQNYRHNIWYGETSEPNQQMCWSTKWVNHPDCCFWPRITFLVIQKGTKWVVLTIWWQQPLREQGGCLGQWL